MATPTISKLAFEDELLCEIPCPKRQLRITRGLGSGLTRSAGGRLFAVGDRGPNLKPRLAVEAYGLTGLAAAPKSAKVMPALEIGPAIAELRIDGERIELVRAFSIRGADGRPLSGLPTPGSANSRMEPALRMDGSPHSPDPGGIDSEGIAVGPDGTMWIGDEYGPSLLKLTQDGEVLMRWIPAGAGASVDGTPYPCAAVLPPLALRRQVNRGFEAIALSPGGERLHLVFQSPLAHPDEAAHAAARHVRIWTIDTSNGALVAQYLYALDEPASFLRDTAEGPVQRSDVKVSEIACIGGGRLLVLERGSATTRIYAVTLSADCRLPIEHAEEATRPTIEQLSAAGKLDLPVLAKTLLLDTDEHADICRDLEGMAVLDDRTLLLVNDNDFGIEDAATEFWRVQFDAPFG